MYNGNGGFLFVAAKLISLNANKRLTEAEVKGLKIHLNGLCYWKYLGFEENPTDCQIVQKIEDIRARKERSKLSQAKTALVELLLSHQEHPWSKSQLTLVFNGLVYACAWSSFLPDALFGKFGDLNSSTYTAIADWKPRSLIGSAAIQSINHSIGLLLRELVHVVLPIRTAVGHSSLKSKFITMTWLCLIFLSSQRMTVIWTS